MLFPNFKGSIAYVLNTAYCYSILEAYCCLGYIKAEHYVFTIDMLCLP